MSCPSRNPARPMTSNQLLQLVALFEAGALSRETGVETGALSFANTIVIGALRDRGLAASRSVRRKGRSWTEYWLTDQGADRARILKVA